MLPRLQEGVSGSNRDPMPRPGTLMIALEAGDSSEGTDYRIWMAGEER